MARGPACAPLGAMKDQTQGVHVLRATAGGGGATIKLPTAGHPSSNGRIAHCTLRIGVGRMASGSCSYSVLQQHGILSTQIVDQFVMAVALLSFFVGQVEDGTPEVGA